MDLYVCTSCDDGFADKVRWVLNSFGRAATCSHSYISSGGSLRETGGTEIIRDTSAIG